MLIFNFVLSQVSGYYTGLIPGKLMKLMVNRNSSEFIWGATTGVIIVLTTATLRSIKMFLTKILSLQWRRNLVASLHSLYFHVS